MPLTRDQQPRMIPNPLWCETCDGRGYLVGDAEWEPYAVQCHDCKDRRTAHAQLANCNITDVDRSYASSILEDLADPDERDTPEQIVAQWICKVRTECSRGGINFGSQEGNR